MRLTALDIQNHPFASSWRGFDPGEVQTFLRLVAEDFEGLVRECETLREKVRALETRVEDLTGNEHALRETLVTAQALSEDLKRTAVKESELMISEAEVMRKPASRGTPSIRPPRPTTTLRRARSLTSRIRFHVT